VWSVSACRRHNSSLCLDNFSLNAIFKAHHIRQLIPVDLLPSLPEREAAVMSVIHSIDPVRSRSRFAPVSPSMRCLTERRRISPLCPSTPTNHLLIPEILEIPTWISVAKLEASSADPVPNNGGKWNSWSCPIPSLSPTVRKWRVNLAGCFCHFRVKHRCKCLYPVRWSRMTMS